MKKYPQAFNFLKTSSKEDVVEVKATIEKIGKYLIKIGSERGYKNIDLTKFRDDINIQKTMNIINWTILSFAEQQREKVASFEDIGMEVFDEW